MSKYTLLLIVLLLVPVGNFVAAPVTEIDHIDFKATSDHATIKVQMNKLWIENYPFSPPSRMSVGGKSFNPKWANHTSEPFVNFEGAFKAFEAGMFKIDVKRGRGVVEIKDRPTAANGWTLTINIIDGPNGADDYYIRITW